MTPRTEQELLDCTIDLATRMRWACHHDRPARRSGGRWMTAIQGHAGFPDLVLARGGVVIFRELKGYDSRGRLGKLSPEQRDWARQIEPGWQSPRGVGPLVELADVLRPFAVWTPDDWPLIISTLTARADARTG